jgi:L-2-hydroxyglutarate oxidase LhgO
VIHAGIYYSQGSLKAKLCVQGRHQIYDYLQKNGIAHQRCGKLIVATQESQVATLEAIQAKAHANGVTDLVRIDAKTAQSMEPALACLAALHSPSTGIIDSHAYMLSLQGDFENAGGLVAFHASVDSAECTPEGIILRMADGTELMTQTLVNAAGLTAPWLAAKFKGLASQYVPNAYFARGGRFGCASDA